MLLVPKPLKYLVAWSVATSIGIGMALLGVRVVLQSTSAVRPPMVAAPDPYPADRAPSRPIGASPEPPAERETERPDRAGGPGRGATTRPASTPTSRPSPSPSASPGRGGDGRGDGEQRRPVPERCEGEVGTAVTESYLMLGGRAAVRFAPDRVCLVSATPLPGHEMSVSQAAQDHLVVRFRGGNHQSELDARWVGQPQARSRETWF
jgi:hypothetical protein